MQWTAKTVNSLVAKIEKENSVFSNKAILDTTSGVSPKNLVGRKQEGEQLLRFLVGPKSGYSVPLVSVYGRSGAGKSTLVRYLCETVDDVNFCLVNLRQSKTVFGAAKMILSELGGAELKSAQGMNLAVERISSQITEQMSSKKGIIVLVLDEFDVIFRDPRGDPSDFVYKLVELQSTLKKRGIIMMIITISNNVISDYSLDDRVKSRIGTSEVFFSPYSKSDVYKILKDRADDALTIKVDDDVLWHCAEVCSQEHGDARRAVDLLRVAAETVGLKGENQITKKHIDKASDTLQKDRIEEFVEQASDHLKYACLSLAICTYRDETDWHKTSKLFETYQMLYNGQPVGQRRFLDYMTELDNYGLASSKTLSRGRYGYSSEFCLNFPPDMIGRLVIGSDVWEKDFVRNKKNMTSKL